MAITHQYVMNWVRSGESIPSTVTLTGDGEANCESTTPAIAASATNYEFDIAVDVSTLIGLVISTDKNLIVKTNSTSAPDDTLTLSAGKPLFWYVGCGMPCPLTVDVTKLYCSRTGGDIADGVAAFKFRSLVDPTPA